MIDSVDIPKINNYFNKEIDAHTLICITEDYPREVGDAVLICVKAILVDRFLRQKEGKPSLIRNITDVKRAIDLYIDPRLSIDKTYSLQQLRNLDIPKNAVFKMFLSASNSYVIQEVFDRLLEKPTAASALLFIKAFGDAELIKSVSIYEPERIAEKSYDFSQASEQELREIMNLKEKLSKYERK